MAGIKSLIISGLLVGLFIFAIISFGIRLTAENSVYNPLMENEAFNSSFGELETQLKDSKTTSEGQLTVQQETNPTTSSGDLLLTSTPSTLASFVSMFRNIYNLTFGLLESALGIPAVILYVITSILLISTILLVWRAIKAGS